MFSLSLFLLIYSLRPTGESYPNTTIGLIAVCGISDLKSLNICLE